MSILSRDPVSSRLHSHLVVSLFMPLFSRIIMSQHIRSIYVRSIYLLTRCLTRGRRFLLF